MSYGYGNGDENIDLEVSKEFELEVEVEFELEADVEFDLDVDHDIDVCVDIDGNDASFQIDIQAFGDDSATELNLAVIVTDDYSSITATGWAGVA